MKKYLAFIVLSLSSAVSFACPVCEKQQPKVLQGITHGTGPQGNMDFIIIWAVAIIVAFTLYYTVKWLVKPGEKNNDHIKRTILEYN